jgi:hypothetical protein
MCSFYWVLDPHDEFSVDLVGYGNVKKGIQLPWLPFVR